MIATMKFSEYIAHHQVFTTAELLGACDSPAAAEEQLRRAVRSGAVERVRRGLLVSNYGRYEEADVDPFAVAMAADGEAVISFHSACVAHGIAHEVEFTCRFRSDLVRTPFSHRGISYEPCGPTEGIARRQQRSDTARIRVTTREQTILDCLDRPSLCGGAEEAVRSASAFAYVDEDALLGLVHDRGASTAARVGWLLSEKRGDWHVSDGTLAHLRHMSGGGPWRLGRCRGKAKGWSKEWRLMLPDESDEVRSWITRS